MSHIFRTRTSESLATTVAENSISTILHCRFRSVTWKHGADIALCHKKWPWRPQTKKPNRNLSATSGLLNSPKTKMINGILLVVFPFPFVQVSLWRCNLETTDWIVVPGAWVPNPPNTNGCTPVAFWGLGFGKVKALLRKPRHQHLLVGDPLNSVG